MTATFGPGIHYVGVDMAPGVYVSTGTIYPDLPSGYQLHLLSESTGWGQIYMDPDTSYYWPGLENTSNYGVLIEVPAEAWMVLIFQGSLTWVGERSGNEDALLNPHLPGSWLDPVKIRHGHWEWRGHSIGYSFRNWRHPMPSATQTEPQLAARDGVHTPLANTLRIRAQDRWLTQGRRPHYPVMVKLPDDSWQQITTVGERIGGQFHSRPQDSHFTAGVEKVYWLEEEYFQTSRTFVGDGRGIGYASSFAAINGLGEINQYRDIKLTAALDISSLRAVRDYLGVTDASAYALAALQTVHETFVYQDHGDDNNDGHGWPTDPVPEPTVSYATSFAYESVEPPHYDNTPIYALSGLGTHGDTLVADLTQTPQVGAAWRWYEIPIDLSDDILAIHVSLPSIRDDMPPEPPIIIPEWSAPWSNFKRTWSLLSFYGVFLEPDV